MTVVSRGLWAMVALCSCLWITVAEGKNIHVSLAASWLETSFLAEACEGIGAAVGPTAFFRCVESSSALASSPEPTTPADHYRLADAAIASSGLSTQDAALLRAELAARVYSPRVEAHRQLALLHQRPQGCADDVPILVLASGEVLCDVARAIEVATGNEGCEQLNFTASEYAELDHVFVAESSRAVEDRCRAVILYGVLGSEATLAAHGRLAAQSTSGTLRYIFRHGVDLVAQAQESWSTPVGLHGYGVTLDVKNMEYKAVDEKKKPSEGKKSKKKSDAEPTDAKADDDSGSSNAAAVDSVIGGFDIARLRQRKPSVQVGLNDFATELAERLGREHEDVQLDLQVWELQQLGFQAAMHILKAKQPLETLEDLLQNFPLRVSKVSKLTFSSQSLRTLQQQLMPLQRMFGEGSNALFVNGRWITEERFDYFSLLAEIRRDESFYSALERVVLYTGVTDRAVEPSSAQEVAFFLNRVKACSLQKADRREKPKRFWIEEDKVLWINDLTTSPLFADAGTSVKELLKTNYYGQPIFPRKNIFHAIFLIDPARREGLEAASMLYRMATQGSAARIGIALVDQSFSLQDERYQMAAEFTVSGDVANEDGLRDRDDTVQPTVSAMVQAVAYTLRDDPVHLLEFLAELHRVTVGEVVHVDTVRGNASAFLPDGVMLDRALSSPEFFRKFLDDNRYFKTLGVRNFPVLFFNGILFQENLQQQFFQGFQQEFSTIRDMIVRQELDDSQTNVYQFLLQHHGAIRRYQPAVFDKMTYVPLRTTAQVRFLELRPFLHGQDYDGQIPLITHVVVLPGRLTMDALQLLHRLLTHLEECTICIGVQFTTVLCDGPNPSSTALGRVLTGSFLALASTPNSTLSYAKQLSSLKRLTSAVISFLEAHFTKKQIVKLVLEGEAESAVIAHLKALSDLPHQVKQSLFNVNAVPSSVTEMDGKFCSATFASEKLTGVQPFILTNGRRTLYDDTFVAEDFLQLEVDEGPRTQQVFGCIENVDLASLLSKESVDVTKHVIAVKLAAVSSIVYRDLLKRGPRLEKHYLPYSNTPYSFSLNPNINQVHARHTVSAVLNPVARESQHLEALVRALSSLAGVDVVGTVFLNPPTEMQKVPITNFYQHVTPSIPTFDSRGSVVPPSAYFPNVPQSVTLTLGLVEPEAWMVFATSAVQDLDNIRLNTMTHSATLHAGYTLRSVLLTGSCHDLTTDQKPRGLPIVMSNRLVRSPPPPAAASATTDIVSAAADTSAVRDTLVMSNYGYFQLQGVPGVWHLDIQPGVASTIYEIVDVEEKDSSSVWGAYNTGAAKGASRDAYSSKPVVITEFTGKHVNLRVHKREGQEHVDLLAEYKTQQQQQGEVGLTTWPPAPGDRPNRPSKPTLNVFSVASGHLYERFLRIMFHTVMKSSSDIHGKNTTRIKFWLIENFLSPGFKRMVPVMAQEYGFDYGFVTYRWPHWLRRQTEKQRTIWAYKILFLDVLFPLDVDKVIFVDADQIVQSDLHELYHLDLQGRPVAYTPFCRENKNPGTVGFRFWDQGFWSDHLQGKPYHISAIYVVDLKRLRQMAAGDQYRIIYDNLSADPNSLANLDQDLPNFAQHQVPIFSLPEEWLWCETWCNQASKERAKTIDLCNNPLTKTPKLENAKRIVPEWEELDAALDRFSTEQ